MKALPQPVNGDFHGALGHLQPQRQLAIRGAVVIAGEVALEPIELFALAVLNEFVA